MAAAASGGAGDAATDWEAVRRSAEIQFAPLPPVQPPETPAWIEWLSRMLRAIFGPAAEGLVAAWPVIEKLLIGGAVVLALLLVWRLVVPLLKRFRKRRSHPGEWLPAHEDALALLEDADRLAAAGRYGEAAHLLLQRSVGQIRAARPEALLPASTAREIAALPHLPQAARAAFATIAERVERSLFALRDLDAGDWSAARAAYANFALAELRR
ncbi:hypothetical protein ABVV53_16945 [Novosphingobium sp. RD2P27]|uniref:DUF4129 domain-containing protein n=1 Tax=Novosphingobium kalidii TaxID=3230299 RepID=A0ABV2D5I3_9SPHN